MRFLILAITFVLGLFVGMGAALFMEREAGAAAVIPCVGSCPDLIVLESDLVAGTGFDIRFFDPLSCEVGEGYAQPGERMLLRVDATIINAGRGPLHIGNIASLPAGLHESNACHGHEHFLGFTSYRLWEPDQYQAWSRLREKGSSEEILARHPELTPVVSQKQGWCPWDFVDVEKVKGRWQVGGDYHDQVYGSAVCATTVYDWDIAGISPGYADTYGYPIAGQWIDLGPSIDHLHGTYVLEVEVNPFGFIEESNYRNNAVSVEVVIP